jgi:hypothetical protein
MAAHRAFYRSLLTSSCGFALSRALNSLFQPVNRQLVRMMFGPRLDAGLLEDLATLLTGGWGEFVHTWVVDGPDPLDPDEFTDRLLRTASALLAPHQKGSADDD